jgi:hypothetical protein
MGKMKDLYTSKDEDMYEEFMNAERSSEINKAVISELKELAHRFQLRELGAKSVSSPLFVAWEEAVELVERAIKSRGGSDS